MRGKLLCLSLLLLVGCNKTIEKEQEKDYYTSKSGEIVTKNKNCKYDYKSIETVIDTPIECIVSVTSKDSKTSLAYSKNMLLVTTDDINKTTKPLGELGYRLVGQIKEEDLYYLQYLSEYDKTHEELLNDRQKLSFSNIRTDLNIIKLEGESVNEVN